MNWKNEWKKLFLFIGIFSVFYYLPIGTERFNNSLLEAFHLAKWYAREHVILCLIPAFFIAGAISVFLSQASVMKYLGAKAKKIVSYGVASVSGSILAVCSCTVLPLFAGIYRMGAGLGPATAFLYSGPAINILAIILTARVLGPEIGIARAVGAIVFSIIIGLAMHFLYRKEEREKASVKPVIPEGGNIRPLWQNAIYFSLMIGILVFANWGKPVEQEGIWFLIFKIKWLLTSLSALGLGLILVRWFGLKLWKYISIITVVIITSVFFDSQPLIPFAIGILVFSAFLSTQKGEASDWFSTSWGFAKQIMPLLLSGVLIAGMFLGRVGHEGLIPSEWINRLVGGNSIFANLFASITGAFMYFATLTEIPILEGLLGSGMGKGPALALLLAGPALSLPNMLVIRSLIGTKKTAVFVSLVIVMATISGIIFGIFMK